MAVKLSQSLAILSVIDPDAYAAGAVDGDVIDMANYEEVMFVLLAGDLVADATLDYAVYADVASGGSFATKLTDKEVTQLTQAGTDSNKQAIIVVESIRVLKAGYRYIRDKLTLGTAGGDVAAIAIGGKRRYQPASDFDLASVDEIV